MARSGVLETGTRLDVRGGGTGLGLAIVQDVLDAYGWRLDLGESNLGGLKAIIEPKTSALDENHKSRDRANS